ncbi:hypothetical protein BZG35_02405 [Brevundimonas sp. LM2]|nr:hypothetical protein BZG35_02405 [Brevundimonas sp. LM2]
MIVDGDKIRHENPDIVGSLDLEDVEYAWKKINEQEAVVLTFDKAPGPAVERGGLLFLVVNDDLIVPAEWSNDGVKFEEFGDSEKTLSLTLSRC